MDHSRRAAYFRLASSNDHRLAAAANAMAPGGIGTSAATRRARACDASFHCRPTGYVCRPRSEPSLGAIPSNAEAAEMFLATDPPALDEVRDILADIRKDDQRQRSHPADARFAS